MGHINQKEIMVIHGLAPAEDWGLALFKPSDFRPRTVKKDSCIVVGAHALLLKMVKLLVSRRELEACMERLMNVDEAKVICQDYGKWQSLVSAYPSRIQITRPFGLAPLKFVPQRNGFTVELSNPMCIYSYVLVTVLISCAIFGVAAEIMAGVERSERMTSLMLQAVSTCDILVVAATAAAGVYGAPRRMRNMILYMESMTSVDTSISMHHPAKDERKMLAVMLAVLALFTILIMDDYSFHVRQARFDRTWDIARNYAGFYFLWYLVVVFELQFAFTAFAVRNRFRAINDALARHVSVSQNGESHLTVPPCETIRRLTSLHNSICDVLQLVNESYGLSLIVVLISTLLHSIVSPYFLIIELSKFALTNQLHFVILQSVWCIFHFLRLLIVVEPCHYTTTEGKRTEELVCRLMTYAPSTGFLSSRLELFSRQLMLRSVNYAPMGICTLDRPLMASVIGGVTTYLIILIQFP